MSGSAPSSEIRESQSAAQTCCGGEEHCATELSATGGSAATTSREPCPPPLQWQQVVAAFREQSQAWDMPTVAGTIRGRVWGEGPTLLFFNGLSGTDDLFALAAFLLKAQFRCVLFDYPQGRRVSWPRLSESSAAIVERFADGESCHLFGTSLGAALALETLIRSSSSVRSATLLAPFAHLPLTIFERSGAAVLRCLPGRAASIPGWRAMQERSHRLWFPPIDATRWLFYLDNAGQTPIAELARRFGMLSQCDLRSRLSGLRTPLLLVHAEGEGVTQSRCREELAIALPHARTEFLHTTGLLAFLTHPHRLAKLIREFVQGVASPALD